MDLSKLTAAGLNEQQAEAYALLLEQGAVSPAEAAPKLKLSRTNAYKVFDKLAEMRLVAKQDKNKKIIYVPANPLALTNFVNEARSQVVHQEEAVKKIMSELLAKYYEKNEQPSVTTVTGRDAVVAAFRNQINLREPIYFIRSVADIPSMGFDTMRELRILPSHHNQARFGITPDPLHKPVNLDHDERSNLHRTWVRQEDYNAPVEWSVSGSMLLMVLYGNEPHAITITNPVIAEAFRQLWHIMDACLRTMPYYKDLPRNDKKADA